MNSHLNAVDDGPLGGLTLQDTHLLKQPDIDVVALEVRWAQPTASLSSIEALAVRDSIESQLDGVRLPIVEGITQRMLAVQMDDRNTAASTTETADAGQQFRTEDQSVSFAVLPHAVALQVNSGYERWSVSARPLIEAVLTAVIPVLKPELVARIGLRYVNRLEDNDCTRPNDWVGKINDALLAPYGGWSLGDRVRSANQVIELAIDDDYSAMLRHGVFYQRTGSASDYLLDIDIFSQRTRVADVDAVVQEFTRMNRTALAIFQQSTVDDYLVDKYGVVEST